MARRRRYSRHRFLNRVIVTLTVLALAWAGLLAVQERVPLPFHIPGYEDVEAALSELYGYGELSPAPVFPEQDAAAPPPRPSADGSSPGRVPNPSGEPELEVHMIDVGQGLSVLLRAPGGEYALIDAGEFSEKEPTVRYLKKKGVKRLEFVIATHAHADHVGGMASVIQGFDVGTVILSDLPEALQPDTRAYTTMLQAIAGKGCAVEPAGPGKTYALGDAVIELLAPIGSYSDLNNYSVVSRVRLGRRSFLIPGDAEEESELDMLRAKTNLQADVLIAGHHGSSTSTTQEFLTAVQPEMAGISCGDGNSYGHPHKETLSKLGRMECRVLRTDLDGSVVFYTDGDSLAVEAEG